MELIEPEGMRRYAEGLNARSWNPADVELHEVDDTDPGSDELLPMKGYIEVRYRPTACRRAYPTRDGTAWAPASERDLIDGRLG